MIVGIDWWGFALMFGLWALTFSSDLVDIVTEWMA